jgi:hypothetical protein
MGARSRRRMTHQAGEVRVPAACGGALRRTHTDVLDMAVSGRQQGSPSAESASYNSS